MTSKKKRPTSQAEPAKRTPDGFRPFAALKEHAIKPAQPEPAPPPRARPPPPSLPDDEALALHRMMSGVTPLESRARRIPRSADALPTSQLEQRRARADVSARAEDDSVHAHLRALVEGGRFEVEDDGRRVEGRRAGISPDVVRKLRRGLYPLDARLDLHGLRAQDARDALERFLGEKRARGERCVLVIHGKGEHSPARQGILRGEISAWLSQGSASLNVDAFSTAQPEDGGEGAVYVLLVR
jgi:DNA-nicking Smr family endonuclease